MGFVQAANVQVQHISDLVKIATLATSEGVSSKVGIRRASTFLEVLRVRVERLETLNLRPYACSTQHSGVTCKAVYYADRIGTEDFIKHRRIITVQHP